LVWGAVLVGARKYVKTLFVKVLRQRNDEISLETGYKTRVLPTNRRISWPPFLPAWGDRLRQVRELSEGVGGGVGVGPTAKLITPVLPRAQCAKQKLE
jgi:hypothetical protein